jgi:hypothetical protein
MARLRLLLLQMLAGRGVPVVVTDVYVGQVRPAAEISA